MIMITWRNPLFSLSFSEASHKLTIRRRVTSSIKKTKHLWTEGSPMYQLTPIWPFLPSPCGQLTDILDTPFFATENKGWVMLLHMGLFKYNITLFGRTMLYTPSWSTMLYPPSCSTLHRDLPYLLFVVYKKLKFHGPMSWNAWDLRFS